MKKNLSASTVQTAIQRLADPRVANQVSYASTIHVAKNIIESLPGVKQLKRSGPEVENALLSLLADEATRKNRNFVSIILRILKSYPTESVKLALAKLIVVRGFTGRNSQLGAEAFLKAAGVHAAPDEVVKVALREARKIVDMQPKVGPQREQQKRLRPRK